MSRSQQRRTIKVEIDLLTTYDTESPGNDYRVEGVRIDGVGYTDDPFEGFPPFPVWRIFEDKQAEFNITFEAGSY